MGNRSWTAERKAAFAKKIRAKWADPAYKARQRAARVEVWQRPGYREAHAEKHREIMRARWANPVTGATLRQHLARLHKSAGQLERALRNIARINADPAMQRAAGERIRALLADPEFRAYWKWKHSAYFRRRRALRQVIPPGLSYAYQQMRKLKLSRQFCLAECWRAYTETPEQYAARTTA